MPSVRKIPNQTHNAQTQSLRIFTSNVRGIVKNWKTIKQIKLENYDILLFNEIWQIRDFENLVIEGFVIANVYQRTENRGGGVIIFTRDTLKFEKYESPVATGIIESTSIIMNNNVITSIYRPPSGNKDQFVDKLIEWTESLGGKRVYIGGDFNLNYNSQDIVYYRIIEESTELKPSITEITRVASNSCIDNILTNNHGRHHVSQICIADHQGMISKITADITKKTKKRHEYRDMRSENWLKFGTEIDKIVISGNDVNEKWSNLLNEVKIAVDSSFPIKHSKTKYKFEMSTGLLRSKRKKKKITKRI